MGVQNISVSKNEVGFAIISFLVLAVLPPILPPFRK